MFDVIPADEIKKWLRSLIVSGEAKVGGGKERFTIHDVKKQTGIDTNTLKWFALKPESANMGVHRQMLLSRCMAMVESGILTSEIQGVKKVLVVNERPKPIQRFGVSFGRKGPKLVLKDRPSIPMKMPSFSEVFRPKV